MSLCFLYFRITRSVEAADILKHCENILEDLENLERTMVDRWAGEVPEQCKRNLARSLLSKNAKTLELSLNFHPQVQSLILHQCTTKLQMDHKVHLSSARDGTAWST